MTSHLTQRGYWIPLICLRLGSKLRCLGVVVVFGGEARRSEAGGVTGRDCGCAKWTGVGVIVEIINTEKYFETDFL